MDGGMLDEMAMGYAPVAGGIQPRHMTGFEGAPLLSQHPLAAMLAQPMLVQAMGQANMVPMGMGHDQNVYDTLRHRQFMAQQRQAMASVAYMERQNVMRTARGAFAMAGVPFGAEQRRAAGAFADMTMFAAPMMAQMNPELLDQMGGMRGSAMVMANQMMAAGRYQIDPATGRMGMSAETMGAAAGNLYRDLYGSRESVMQMHGVTAGQAGALYGNLVQRGMVATTPGSLQERMGGLPGDQMRAAARSQGVSMAGGVSGLSAADVDKLALDPGVAESLRRLDVEKIKRSIKGYSSAVAAVRDIFGDMGRPNAPMGQLMQSLEAMTMGQLSQMDPDRAGRMVRQTYNLARNTGVSLDNAMMMQQHAGAKAASLGLEPVFAIQATQGGLAFGGAYRGQGLAAHTAWGAMSADQLQQADINLRVGAAASNAANARAVVTRLARAHGGFEEGSEAANVANAIQGGFSQYQDATGNVQRLGGLKQRDYFRILTQARGTRGQRLGITENDVREMLSQRFDNREDIDQFNIGAAVRNDQGVSEVRPFLTGRLQENLANRLINAGVGRNEATASLAQAGRGMIDRIMDMSREDFADAGKRQERMATIFREGLAGTVAGRTLGRMSIAEQDAFFRQSAVGFYGRGNEALQASGFGMSFQGAHQAFDSRTLQQSDAQRQRAAFEGRLQDALSPLGKGGPLARAMDALQNARPGDDMMQVLGQALGGVKTEDVSRRISGPMTELNTKIEAIKKLQNNIQNTTDTTARTDMLKRLGTMEREAKGQAADIAKTAGDYGIFGQGDVRASLTKGALDASRDLAAQITDVASLRGGFGLEVNTLGSEANLAADQYGRKGVAPNKYMRGATVQEAAAVIMARRQRMIDRKEVDPEHLKRATEAARGLNPYMSPADVEAYARRNILKEQQLNVAQITDEQIAHERQFGRIESDEELRALVLVRRQTSPLRAADEQVKTALDDLRRTDPGATDMQARGLADARQRARRWGIDDREITMLRKGVQGRPVDPSARDVISEREAIGMAVHGRERAQFTVTPEQIAEVRAHPKNKAQVEGKSDDQVKALILAERAKARSDRFAKFWAEDDGARFRETVDLETEQMESIANRLIETPDVAKRFGTAAVEMSKKLRDIQQRRRVLAFKYTGGDIHRLRAGDFSVADADEYSRTHEELMSMTGEEQRIVEAVHATQGQQGRQFRRGTRDAARASLRGYAVDTPGGRGLHARWIKAGMPTGEEFTYDGKTERYTYADYEQLMKDEMNRLGDAEEAAKLMGMSDDEVRKLMTKPDAQLTPEERKKKEDFLHRKADVAVARRMNPDDETRVRAFTEKDEAMEKLAQRHGVTKKELLDTVVRGKKGPARLSALSDDESKRLDAARAGYDKARMDQTSGETMVRSLERAVGTFDAQLKKDPGNRELQESRDRAQTQLNEVKIKVKTASDAAAGFATGVEADARRRGVSTKDYLAGQGYVTAADRDRILADAAKMGASLDELKDMAVRLGLKSPEELATVVKNVIEPQLKLAEEARRTVGESGTVLLKDIGAAFGMEGLATDDSRAKDMASRIGASPRSKAWAGYVLSGQQQIAEASRGMGGKAELVKRWQAAMGESKVEDRDKKLKQLQHELGIDMSTEAGRNKWSDVAGALAFQKQSGLLEGKDGKFTMDQLSRAYDKMMQSGDMRLPGQPGAGQGGRQEISGTLRLYMDGNLKGDLNARTGGAVGNSSPPP